MSQVGTPRFPLQDSSSKGAGVDAGAPSHLQIRNPQSKIENSQGGIAQLVERQLCKLEVRGSNPLASSLRSRGRAERGLSHCSLGEGGPFSSCDCKRSELRLGKPTNSMGKFFYMEFEQYLKSASGRAFVEKHF